MVGLGFQDIGRYVSRNRLISKLPTKVIDWIIARIKVTIPLNSPGLSLNAEVQIHEVQGTPVALYRYSYTLDADGDYELSWGHLGTRRIVPGEDVLLKTSVSSSAIRIADGEVHVHGGGGTTAVQSLIPMPYDSVDLELVEDMELEEEGEYSPVC